MVRGLGYKLYLTPREAVLVNTLVSKGAADVVRMQLVGAEPSPRARGIDELPGKSHYLVGNDPANWRKNVPHYARVRYEGIYPGVDLVYYGNKGQVEYDFIVLEGANPGQIGFSFVGVDRIDIGEGGDLNLYTAAGKLHLQKPFVYQEVNDVRHEIAGRYVLTERKRVGFEIANYDTIESRIISS